MQEDNIKVIIIEPNKDPYVKEIPNTLEAKQKIVGGLIECVPTYFSNTSSYDFIVNEEGKITGLPWNRFVYDKQDILFGNIIVAKVDELEGDFISIDDSEVEFLFKQINEKCPICTDLDIQKILDSRDMEEEMDK